MTEQEIAPPSLPTRFFRWFCNPDYRDDIEGDLYEIFQKDVAARGEKKARFLYMFHVMKLMRPAIVRKSWIRIKNNPFPMFKNYLFTAFRNMKREKLFALINMAGLAIGIGCGLVIYKIIDYEMSFDKHHTNFDKIYRVIIKYQHPEQGTVHYEGQVHPLGEAFKNDFSGVEASMTFYAKGGQITVMDGKGNPDRFQEYKGVVYAQKDFFKIFDFDFIAGDPQKALVNRGSVVITSSLAQKYFKLKPGEVSQAMGNNLIMNNKTNFIVTGVIEDTPQNSDIPFTFIGNYEDQTASNPYFNAGTDWQEYNSDTNCWIMVSGEMSAERMQPLLPAFFLKYIGKERAATASYELQPLSMLHFDDRVQNYNKRTVSYTKLGVLALIGVFLVVSACINFINMSTAQAIKRAKEIGVRKSLGVRKRQLIFQFIGETTLISFVSSIGGLVIANLLFIYLADILGYQLQSELFKNPKELMFLIVLILGTGLLSGFYPAIVMARMNPIKALKNSLSVNNASGLLSLRRSLVVLQFVISQVLIIGTIVAAKQMDYFLGNDIGFSKEAVLVTRVAEAKPETLEALKNNIMKLSGVEKVSFSVASPMALFRVNNEVAHPAIRPDDNVSANLKTADENYVDLFHLKIIAGKNLPAVKDNKEALINRKFAETLGHKNPEDAIGDIFKYGRFGLEFRIVGVVEDFHTVSFHYPVENIVLSNLPWNIKEMAVKLNTASGNFSDVQATVNGIKTEWDKLFPETIFDYTFLDQQIAQIYQNEKKTSQLFTIFSAVAIFIGCLGLYGLVSYMANQKTKEIGIRKVMGASTTNIFAIFSKEMLILVAIAFVLAAPLAWYAMNSWLQAFQFKISISPAFFGTALAISAGIAFITMTWKAITASRANPVDSLRSE